MTIKQSSPAAKTTKSFEESLWDTATNNTNGAEIRQRLVGNDLSNCRKTKAYPLAA